MYAPVFVRKEMMCISYKARPHDETCAMMLALAAQDANLPSHNEGESMSITSFMTLLCDQQTKYMLDQSEQEPSRQH